MVAACRPTRSGRWPSLETSSHEDPALALIIFRVVEPVSKLTTLPSWADSALGVDLEVAGRGHR